MSRTRALIALAALAGSAVAATPAGLAPVASALDAVCVADASAATAFVTELPTTAPFIASVAGADVLIVNNPMIAPGIPTAMLASDAGFCSVDAFNLLNADLSTADAASLFASIAAMQWLGDVEVRNVGVEGDRVLLTTFGGRHGVSSDWDFSFDAVGIRSATFTTTAFGAGFDGADAGDWEGVTSLPGHTRSWERDASGLLQINATIADDLAASWAERDEATARAAEMVGNGPGDPLEHTFSDGLTIRLTYGVAATPRDWTVDTGVGQADRLRTLHAGIKSIYDDFMDWGVRDPFENTRRSLLASQIIPVTDEAGYINIDSGLSAYCLACAYLVDAIEVHMAYVFPEVAPTVANVSYPDVEAFFVDVMGHELVHSLQGGYSNGAAGVLTNAFSEGTARASESLFDGSANTFQSRSIMFSDSGNGCNGFENGRGGWIAAQSSGPFAGHTYDACYFWLTYYAEHGPEGLVALLEALPETLANTQGQNAASLNLRMLDIASGLGDGSADLARWAAAYTAGNDGDGYTVTGANGVPQNWFSLMANGQRSTGLSTTQTADVSDGGTRGFTVERSGAITALPSGARAFLFELTDGTLTMVGPVEVGDAVEAGQILTIVKPTRGGASGSVRIS